MYHNDIKLTSGAVILAALLLSITDSKAASITKAAKSLTEFQQANVQTEQHRSVSTAQPD